MRGAVIRMIPALVALTCCGVAATACAEKASLVAVVVDGDTGEPIQGMPVKANFRNLSIQRNPWAKDELSFRVADKNGRCKFSGDTNIGRVVLRTKGKEPWYETQLPVVYTNSINGRLQPDNLVVTVKVWKVGCPIPLIVKELGYYYEDDMFLRGHDVLRFDFMAGDYLPPVGTGVVADVEFRRTAKEEFDGDDRISYYGEMTTTFLGEGNGYVEVAPNAGSILRIRNGIDAEFRRDYVSWAKQERRPATRENVKTNSLDRGRCFCFRVRSMKDETGVITNAYYGKIYHDFGFEEGSYPARTGEAERDYVGQPDILYYLNPKSMDKNLEFHGRANLCPGMGRDRTYSN